MNIDEHVNREELALRLDHDMTLLRELVSLFTADSSVLLDRIRSAIDRGDSEALRKEAHTLKGSVSNFSAYRACRVAFELESLGRAGDLTGSSEIFDSLSIEIGNVRNALDMLILKNEL